MRRLKFSLRFLLIVVAAVATTLGIWKLRPPNQLTVQLTPSGTLVVDNGEIQISAAPGVLKRASAWRRFWFRSPHLVFQPHPSSSYTDVQGIIEQARNVGFDKVSLAVVDLSESIPK